MDSNTAADRIAALEARVAALTEALRAALSYAHDSYDGTSSEGHIASLDAVLAGEPTPPAPALAPAPGPAAPTAAPDWSAIATDRDETIAAIRAHLRRRSGRAWSVTGGRGTAWGWISIAAPPARRVNGYLSDADRAELSALLGVEIHRGDRSCEIAASSTYRREYLDRAAGILPPRVIAKPYWD